MDSVDDVEYDDIFFGEQGYLASTGKLRLLDQSFKPILESEGGHLQLGISKEQQERYQG